MRVSEQWLREWVNPSMTLAELCECLTTAGIEVDSIIPVAVPFSGVVVGHVIEAIKHPNADKLSLCKVDIGQPDPLTIVCGAKNVRTGLKVALAKIGAILPGNFPIQATKLRGIDSMGMICSAVELRLAETSEGIIELPSDAPVGIDLRNYLLLNDNIIEFEITPNRGDCLSTLGMAREIAALTNSQLNSPQYFNCDYQKSLTNFTLELQAQHACPHYVGAMLHKVNLSAKTPQLLVERLKRAGLKSISPVVDITNYVMLELGQPMHAFALNNIAGPNIKVRYAEDGEKLLLLDGKELVLSSQDLVIADSKKPLALAGIMGGADSAVMADTQDVFLESAFFHPALISQTAKKYFLKTDSSYRFERGVDFELQNIALHRAIALLEEITGAELAGTIDAVIPDCVPRRTNIFLPRQLSKRILGVDIPETEVTTILTRLGMKVTNQNDGWQVVPSSYRFDVTIQEDLVEELARVYGYHRIAGAPIQAKLSNISSDREIPRQRLNEILQDKGYVEVITYSFTDPKLEKIFSSNTEALALQNPIAPNLSVMRTSMFPGLITAAKYNLNRKQHRMRFFEIGLCFVDETQPLMLGGLALGEAYPEQWGMPKRQLDFYDVKADIEAVLTLFTPLAQITLVPTENFNFLHPKQSAQILINNQEIGYIGMLHPQMAHELEVPDNMFLFSLNLDLLPFIEPIKCKEVSKFPLVERDIAIVVDKLITWQQIRADIVATAGKILHNIQVFDLFEGANLEKKCKSIAIHLIFQDISRTLIDVEIDGIMAKIVDSLGKSFNAKLRG